LQAGVTRRWRVAMDGIIIIFGFIAVGLWLEPINGKHGFVDELLTPLPLCLLGCVITLAERLAA
jgi:hypothetical protein